MHSRSNIGYRVDICSKYKRLWTIALGDWEALPPIRKTWENFKTHFKNAQKQLCAICGPTMQQSGYHHANHLAQQLKTDIQQRDSNLLTYIQSAIDSSTQSDAGSLTGTMTTSDMSTVTPTQHQANALRGRIWCN